MKLVLAFLAGSALVAAAVFLIGDSQPTDANASPLAPRLAEPVGGADMELQPVAPRKTPELDATPLQPVEAAEVQPLTPAGNDLGILDEDQLAELVAQRVEQVLDDRERAEREERDQREEQFIKDRAHAIAEEVGLGHSDELRLTELMLAANEKRDALRDEMRNGAMPFEERMAMRDKFDEIQSTYDADLEAHFGPTLKEQIDNASSNGWRGGRGGPPGGGRGRDR